MADPVLVLCGTGGNHRKRNGQTLARRHEISVTCKARLPEQIPVEDVDLCVILGNLLDNAIEACQQVEEGSRFLRIYLAVNKGQFYLSVQNSAKEEPDFDQRNYISKKRGIYTAHRLNLKYDMTAGRRPDVFLIGLL